MPSIEDRNYYNDPRVCNPAELPYFYDEDGEKVELPWKWEVCDLCGGNGTHVNPSLDAGGLSDDCADDEDFMDDYMAGAYDVPCNSCQGRRVVPGVDEKNCSEELLDAYYTYLQEEAEVARVRLPDDLDVVELLDAVDDQLVDGVEQRPDQDVRDHKRQPQQDERRHPGHGHGGDRADGARDRGGPFLSPFQPFTILTP